MEAFALWPVMVVVLTATITDLWRRRIPNWLTLPFLAAGLAAGGVFNGFAGLVRSAAGAGLAVLILAAFCLLRGMGWGDLKLCAAVGAWIGPAQMGFALVVTAMAGGLIAVAALLWRGIGHKLPKRLTLDDPGPSSCPTRRPSRSARCFLFCELDEGAAGGLIEAGGKDGLGGVKNLKTILVGPNEERRKAVLAELTQQQATIVAELKDYSAVRQLKAGVDDWDVALLDLDSGSGSLPGRGAAHFAARGRDRPSWSTRPAKTRIY